MWTDSYTAKQNAISFGLALAALGVLVVTGLLLKAHGPGNMGSGFLVGGGIGLVAAGIGLWRVIRRPENATTFERAWTQTGDERDNALLTRSLAVLGLLCCPLTAVAAIAIGLGATVEAALALLLVAELVVGAVAFAVIGRRS